LISNVSYNDTYDGIDDTFTSINNTRIDTVKYIKVTNKGTGYLHSDTITITPSGINSTPVIAVANINYGVLDSIRITNGGSGYITAPIIGITGGSGSGATATAYLSVLGIGSIKVDKIGSGYTSIPTVTIEGDGSGALAEAVLNTDNTLKSIKITNEGSGYYSPTVKITGGSGSGATANVYASIDLNISDKKYKTLTYMYNYLETKYVSLSSNNNKNYLLNVVTSINNTLNNDDKIITATTGSKESKYLFAKKINEMKVPPEYEDEDAIYTKADYISTTSFETTYYMNLLILLCFIIGTIYANIKKSV
jgi:hypothetical protein